MKTLTYTQFKNQTIADNAKEYNCTRAQSLDNVGECEIKRLWRIHIKTCAERNAISLYALKSFVRIFGKADYLTTFRGKREQLIYTNL